MRTLKILHLTLLLFAARPWLTLKLLIRECRRLLFSSERWYEFQFDLRREFESPDPETNIRIRELTIDDAAVLLNLRQQGLDEGQFRDIAIRLYWLKSGVPTCHVGVTLEGSPCCLCWLIHAKDNDRPQGKRFRPLASSEVLLENIWTHRDYRGKRFMKSLTMALFDKAKREGGRRALAYIREGNRQSLAGARAIGWELCALVRVRRRMSFRSITFEPASPDLLSKAIRLDSHGMIVSR
jgi:hypothetical protein